MNEFAGLRDERHQGDPPTPDVNGGAGGGMAGMGWAVKGRPRPQPRPK